jgi:hypothetical protein
MEKPDIEPIRQMLAQYDDLLKKTEGPGVVTSPPREQLQRERDEVALLLKLLESGYED